MNAKTGSIGNSKISATSALKLTVPLLRQSFDRRVSLDDPAPYCTVDATGFECRRVCKGFDREISNGVGGALSLSECAAGGDEGAAALSHFAQIEFLRNQSHNNKKNRMAQLFTFQQLLRMYNYSWTAAMFKWMQILRPCFWATASAAAWSRNTHGADHSPGSLQLYKYESKSRVRQKQ